MKTTKRRRRRTSAAVARTHVDVGGFGGGCEDIGRHRLGGPRWRCRLLLTALCSSFLLAPHVSAMASSAYVSGIKLPGNRIEDQTTYGEIKSVLNGRVELPCNLTLPSSDDAIHLVFWYKGNTSRVPIYTLDARAASTLTNATHFPSDHFSPNRATFLLDAFRPLGLLRIDPVLEQDHSDYRCRVDFRWGRTISSVVSLHVVVPPKHIKIRDQSGRDVHNSTIGPYNENTNVTLVCESKGGIPPPMLQWFKNNVMIDASYSFGGDGVVSNELVIDNLSQAHLNDKYICQASNMNSSATKEAFIVLDINLMPSEVRIVQHSSARARPLLAGRKVDVRCESTGSRPNAVLKWYKKGEPLAVHSSESYEGNKTTSAITLMPTMADNNVQLACRSYNPRLMDKYIQDVWQLQVLYPPQLVLLIHNKTRSMVVSEHATVIIECHISANPSLVDIQIYFNSTRIFHQKQFDVQRENVTRLVISEVSGKHHGRYQCIASNQEGLTRSNEIHLTVLYAPHCADRHQEEVAAVEEEAEDHNNNNNNQHETMMNNEDNRLRPKTSLTAPSSSSSSSSYHYAVALNESIRLACRVQANPPATHFFWTLNAGGGGGASGPNLNEDHIFAQTNANNELTFVASKLENYGHLMCWAKNELGVQRRPCVFVITKAGPPSALVGCSVSNKTTTSLTVQCFPADDGGSPQTFHAQLFADSKADVEPYNSNDNFLGGSSGGGSGGQAEDTSRMSSPLPPGDTMNFTSTSSPVFLFGNLRPGTTYLVELYASNARGPSETTRLSVATLFTKNTKLVSSSLQEIEYDPIFSISIAALFTLLLVMMAAYVTCRLRHRQINRQERTMKEEQIKQNFVFTPSHPNPSSSSSSSTGEHNGKANNADNSIQLQPYFAAPSTTDDRTSAELFPYDAATAAAATNSKSKLNLYVIKEIKDEPVQGLRNVLGKANTSSPIQLTNSLAVIEAGGATLIPFSATASSTSPMNTAEAYFPQSFVEHTTLDPQMLARQMMEQQQQQHQQQQAQQQQQQHVSTTGEPIVTPTAHYYQHSGVNGTILYAPASIIPSPFVSINPKLEPSEAMFGAPQFGVYQAEGLNAGTFTLMSPYSTLTLGRHQHQHHPLGPPHHQPSSTSSTSSKELSHPIPLNPLNVSSLEPSEEETSTHFEYAPTLV